MKIRGMRDIKTHGSLDRAGLLIGVAKNFHQRGGHRETTEDSDWGVKQYICRDSDKKIPFHPLRFKSPFFPTDFDRKIKKYLLEIVQNNITEMNQAINEGILVSTAELARLKDRLSKLENTAEN